MNKKNEIIIIIVLLLVAVFWRYIFWSPGVYGVDVYYHYTVTEQALQNGHLTNDNNLALCYKGVKNGHPHGFYALPYIFGKIFGLERTFIFLPVLLAIISLLLAYIFLQYIFNKKVAMITIFFAAISLAHISKSFPFSWRGENLIYPFLLFSLIGLYKFLVERKKLFAILAGISSGVTIWFWNGYPLVIIIYYTALFSTLGYKYFTKTEDLRENIKASAISIFVQALVLYSLFFSIELWEKGYLFAKEYYPFLFLGAILILGILYKGYTTKSRKYLIASVGCGLLLGAIFFQKIKVLLSGFGSVQAVNLAITPELIRTPLNQYFFAFHILLITSIAGAYYIFKKLNAKRILFLGYLIPSLYLIATASRYIYFATIPIITLTAIFLNNKKVIKNKFDLFVFLTAVLMIFMLIYSLYAIPIYYVENVRTQGIEPYFFLRENTEKDACIVDISNRGATVEFFAKRYYYFHPLGYDNEHGEKAARLLLLNNIDLGIDHLYVLLNYADLQKINLMNKYLELRDIGFYRIAASGDDEPINETEIREELDFMKNVFVNNQLMINKTGQGCAYVTQSDIFYLKNGVCDTTIFKMITNQTVENFQNIYFQDGFAIYKYVPTNNLVKKE